MVGMSERPLRNHNDIPNRYLPYTADCGHGNSDMGQPLGCGLPYPNTVATERSGVLSSAAMQITTQTSSSTETQLASTSSAAAQNTSGLSTGAKAGIGIGAAAIFVVILVAAIFWMRRKRHVKDSSTMVDQKQRRRNELDGTEVVRKSETWVGATPIEADSNNAGAREHNGLTKNPNELEGTGRAELVGS